MLIDDGPVVPGQLSAVSQSPGDCLKPRDYKEEYKEQKEKHPLGISYKLNSPNIGSLLVLRSGVLLPLEWL